MPVRDHHSQLSRARASVFCGIVATLLVCSLCTAILSGYLQVHGWLMCISWGCLIPLGVVIACFRTVRGMGAWWFHLHRVLALLGFLISVAGLAVGVYLDPGEGGLFWQHKIIGITVNVLGLAQVAAGILIKPPNTSNLRRVWNVFHWTLGRSALALGIANIFIGMYLSSDAYKNIIAQAVVLGGFFIIVMLKNDLEYLLVGCTPAEEEERLKAAHVTEHQHATAHGHGAWADIRVCLEFCANDAGRDLVSTCMLSATGSQEGLGQTGFPALAKRKGPGRRGKGKSRDEPRTTDDPILDSSTSTLEMIPAGGAETSV